MSQHRRRSPRRNPAKSASREICGASRTGGPPGYDQITRSSPTAAASRARVMVGTLGDRPRSIRLISAVEKISTATATAAMLSAPITRARRSSSPIRRTVAAPVRCPRSTGRSRAVIGQRRYAMYAAVPPEVSRSGAGGQAPGPRRDPTPVEPVARGCRAIGVQTRYLEREPRRELAIESERQPDDQVAQWRDEECRIRAKDPSKLIRREHEHGADRSAALEPARRGFTDGALVDVSRRDRCGPHDEIRQAFGVNVRERDLP